MMAQFNPSQLSFVYISAVTIKTVFRGFAGKHSVNRKKP